MLEQYVSLFEIIFRGGNIYLYKSGDLRLRGKHKRSKTEDPASSALDSTCCPQVEKSPVSTATPYAPLEAALTYRSRLTAAQRAAINLVLSGLGIGCLVAPEWMIQTGSITLFAVFFLMMAWRCTLLFAGLILRLKRPEPTLQDVPDHSLPLYTILIPAYRESALMAQMARALRAIDWPADRLDVIILLEADDQSTIAAAEAAHFPERTRLFRVPSGGPRTKPNALNHGLQLAAGAYVTVYDIEDLPEPVQLRAAYKMFQVCDPEVVCLQAPLIADNANQCWLSAHWGLEYDIQFRLLLTGLSLYKMPLLLGGTSNHFRKDTLLALGGWDAWNVTEDADLGMRLTRASLRAETIAVPTYEDAPTNFRIWMSQRSRWIKGHMQTWLVLMRNPAKTLRQMGLMPFLCMQLSLGAGILAPLFHAPCFGFVLATYTIPGLRLGLAGTLLLATGLTVSLFGGLAAPGEWSLHRVIAVLTRPIYWPLHSFAAYRAVWELAKDPFFWAKTPHNPRPKESPAHCSIGSSASASPPA